MKCPSCGAVETQPQIAKDDAVRLRRLYTCLKCGTGWATVENLQSDSVREPASWLSAARRMRRAGMTYAAIAKALGRDYTSLYREMKPSQKEAKRLRDRLRWQALSQADKDIEAHLKRIQREGRLRASTGDLTTYQQSHPG